MTYIQAKQLRQQLNDLVEAASRELNVLVAPHKGAMGMTSDVFRATPEYKAAKAKYDVCNDKAKAVNTWFMKTFKKEYAAERKAKYATMVLPV